MDKIMKHVSYKVTAPGKVILHGEHSVVYGKPALAAAIAARTSFCITVNPTLQHIVINLTAIDLCLRISTNDVNELLGKLQGVDVSDHSAMIDVISGVIDTKYSQLIELYGQKYNSVKAILYVLCGTLLGNNITSLECGFEGKLESKLSVGSGVGSSASFGICLAAAFLILSRKCNSSDNNDSLTLTEDDKNFINKWAFNCEKIIHGTPSGIDNTVCTFGNIVRFVKGEEPSQVRVNSQLPILLVDTKVARSTGKLVANVKNLQTTFPKCIDRVLDAMEEVVNEAIPLYVNYNPKNLEDFKKIEQLWEINNNLLRAIGVSHTRLEQIFEIASRNGFSSKLTGAGGGGFAIILLGPNYSEKDSFNLMCKQLTENNFDFTETIIGSDGVQVEELKE